MLLRCLCYVHSVLSRGFSALPRVCPERVFATHSCEASRGDWPTRRHECDRTGECFAWKSHLETKTLDIGLDGTFFATFVAMPAKV